jgi:glycine betaine/proline transport system permease protein
MMGINQVIMMALALVVLACFIGAEGIGGQVWLAIRNLDVGWAMEGGLCILFMAILFDRFSMSFSKQKETLRWMFKNFTYFLNLGKNIK